MTDLFERKLSDDESFLLQSGWISQGFAPVIDGPGGFLPDNPYYARGNGTFNRDVQVISGHTSEDGSMYLLPCKTIYKNKNKNENIYCSQIIFKNIQML